MGKDPVVDIEIERLFRRYREAPESHVFAPLADACRKAGRLEEAIEICRKGVEKHPGYTSGWVVLGKCFYDAEDLERARGAFERVTGLDGENLVALKYLGMIAARLDDPEGARSYFDRILDLDPENEEICRMLENLEAQDDIIELKPVEEEFEGEEITLGEEEAEISDELATVTLAEIFARQGYKGKAIKIYRELLARNPDNELAKKKLGELTGSEPEKERAEEVADSGDGGAAREKEESPLRDEEPGLEGDAAESTGRSGRKGARTSGADGRTRPSKDGDRKGFDQFRKWLENSGK